ncbi:hypothetical protein ACJ5NV_07615 [Loktanella agnita]|uniref:hypothetical protein n=1 Tax=Loktanella agnita TaxID=287097 RepID=UPI003987B0A7
MRWIILAIIAAIPTIVWSVPVAIQTGEHANFTRVVLTIPAGADWRLGRNDTSYVLRLPVTDGYMLERFFDVIPRDRIGEVTQVPARGELQLAVNCLCNANAFLYRSDILVIDIRDGAPSEDSRFEMALDGPQIGRNYIVPRDSLLPLFLQTSSTPSAAETALAPQITESAEAPQNPDSVETEDAMNALEQAITQSLARGLSQGLLEPDMPAPDDMALPSETSLLYHQRAPGIRARTSVDNNALPDDSLTSVTQQGDICLPDAYFDVASWGDDRPFFVQISEARAAVLGEFDEPDENAVLQLAQRFVYFGFGREAMQTLALDGVQSRERRYLTGLARIIDDEPVADDLFAQQVSCASQVAFWALLAREDGAQDAQFARPAVLRTFKTLPSELQAHLAPKLTARFTTLGDMDAALQALEVATTSPTPVIDAALAGVEVTRVMGDDKEAAETLEALADTHTRMTAEAMTTFLRDAVQNDIAVDDSDFLLADALRFENAALPVASTLTAAEIRAYIHGDRFSAARVLLAEETKTLGPDQSAELRDEIAQAAVARMTPAEFLTFAFDETNRPVPQITENAMARRLLQLGFPDAALRLIAAPSTGEIATERQYLTAEALLALGRPADASVALADLSSVRATTLRETIADLQTRDIVVPVIDANAPAAEDYWRQGNWRDLVQSDDPLLRAASEAMLEQEVADLDNTAPLANGRALLSRAEESRDIVTDLLDRFAIPEEY